MIEPIATRVWTGEATGLGPELSLQGDDAEQRYQGDPGCFAGPPLKLPSVSATCAPRMGVAHEPLNGRRYPYESLPHGPLSAPVKRAHYLVQIGGEILNLWRHYAEPVRKWYERRYGGREELAHRFEIKRHHP